MTGHGVIEVGPILRESLVIALRRWWIFVLSGVALAIGCLGWMTLLGRCLFSPACSSVDTLNFIVTSIRWIPWLANRLVGWPVMAFALYRVLAAERRNSAHAETGRAPFRRRFAHFAWCFGYFVAISASATLIWMVPIPTTMPSELAWLAFCVEGVVASGIWAYIDARFSIHLTAMICSSSEGLARNWATLTGDRRRVFLLFFVIEVILFVVDHFAFSRTYEVVDYWTVGRWASSFTLLPRDFFVLRLPEYVEYVLYISLSNMICASAFVAIHRRLAASSLHGTATVFD